MSIDHLLCLLRAAINAAVAAAMLEGKLALADVVVCVDADQMQARLQLRSQCPPVPFVSAGRVPVVVRYRNSIALTSLSLRAVGCA